jgi:hypothetical protein
MTPDIIALERARETIHSHIVDCEQAGGDAMISETLREALS